MSQHEHRWTLGKMQNPVRGFLHGSAAVVALAGTVAIVARAGGWSGRLSVAIFGLGLIALYTTSSLYHSLPWREAWKRRMQRLDHSMIFVLIAATYTPVAVLGLEGWWRVATLVVVWGIAVAGISHHAFWPLDSMRLSIVLLVTMGWLSLFIVFPFAQRAGWSVVVLTSLGGVLYTVGMVFMVTAWPRLWPRVFSSHELFHVFVIGGSVAHYVMAYRYLTPLST